MIKAHTSTAKPMGIHYDVLGSEDKQLMRP